MGIYPFEWFQSEKKDPPSAFDWEDTAPSEYEPPIDNRWAPPERRAELEAELNPRAEEEVAEWFAENPDESDDIEKEKTVHEKMYEIATAKYKNRIGFIVSIVCYLEIMAASMVSAITLAPAALG